MPASLKTKGTYKSTKTYLNNAATIADFGSVESIAKRTVQDLSNATKEYSETISNSWSYKIYNTRNGITVEFDNSDIQNGTNMAIILDEGHATSDGKWISGKNYLNPIMEKTYNDILNSTWKELKNL